MEEGARISIRSIYADDVTQGPWTKFNAQYTVSWTCHPPKSFV